MGQFSHCLQGECRIVGHHAALLVGEVIDSKQPIAPLKAHTVKHIAIPLLGAFQHGLVPRVLVAFEQRNGCITALYGGDTAFPLGVRVLPVTLRLLGPQHVPGARLGDDSAPFVARDVGHDPVIHYPVALRLEVNDAVRPRPEPQVALHEAPDARIKTHAHVRPLESLPVPVVLQQIGVQTVSGIPEC